MMIIFFIMNLQYPEWYSNLRKAISDSLKFSEIPDTLLCIFPTQEVLDSSILATSYTKFSGHFKFYYYIELLNNSDYEESLAIVEYKGQTGYYNPLLPCDGSYIRVISRKLNIKIGGGKIYKWYRELEIDTSKALRFCDFSIGVFLKKGTKWKLVYDKPFFFPSNEIFDINKLKDFKLKPCVGGIMKYKNSFIKSGGKAKVVYYLLNDYWNPDTKITIRLNWKGIGTARILYPRRDKIFLSARHKIDSLVVLYSLPRVLRPLKVVYAINIATQTSIYLKSPEFIILPHKNKFLLFRDRMVILSKNIYNKTIEKLKIFLLLSTLNWANPVIVFILLTPIFFIIGLFILCIKMFNRRKHKKLNNKTLNIRSKNE